MDLKEMKKKNEKEKNWRTNMAIIAKRPGAAHSEKRKKLLQNTINSTYISDKGPEKAMNGLSRAP